MVPLDGPARSRRGAHTSASTPGCAPARAPDAGRCAVRFGLGPTRSGTAGLSRRLLTRRQTPGAGLRAAMTPALAIGLQSVWRPPPSFPREGGITSLVKITVCSVPYRFRGLRRMQRSQRQFCRRRSRSCIASLDSVPSRVENSLVRYKKGTSHSRVYTNLNCDGLYPSWVKLPLTTPATRRGRRLHSSYGAWTMMGHRAHTV